MPWGVVKGMGDCVMFSNTGYELLNVSETKEFDEVVTTISKLVTEKD